MGGILDSLFGKKPEVAPFVPTDLQEEQKRAIGGNISVTDEIGQLADQIAKESGEATRIGMEAVLPGSLENIDKATEQIKSFLGGTVPDDVADEIIRRTAELSTQRGITPRSRIGANFSTRELGLTSLGLVQQGIGMAQTWMAQAQGGFQQLNFGSMFVDPMNQASFTASQRETERSIKQAEFNIRAAPDPGIAGLGKIAATAVGFMMGGPAGAAIGSQIGSVFGSQSDAANAGAAAASPYTQTYGVPRWDQAEYGDT